MNLRQLEKLGTIVSKLEALQAEVTDQRLGGLLAEAKSKLIKAHTEAYYAKQR
jgi:hypothetical protein